jgi:TRAP-type C4-dicarboxylate transport system permease small subunit
MEKILRLIEKVSFASGYGAGLILIMITLLTMVEVVTRYIFRHPLILCDEFGGYSLFAITLLGLAYCAKEGGHIRITFLVERLRPKTSGWLRIGTLLLIVIYTGVASKISWDFLIDSFHRNIRSNSWVMTPLKWPQMALPIGFTLFFLIAIVMTFKAVGKVRKGKRVEESGGAKIDLKGDPIEP